MDSSSKHKNKNHLENQKTSIKSHSSINHKENNKSIIKKILFFINTLFLLVLILFSIFINRHTQDLLTYRSQNMSLKVLDREGFIIKEINNNKNNSTEIQIEDVSKSFLDSIIVIEDQDYYRNRGIDIRRTFKCSVTSFLNIEQCGGSTITQQYVEMLENSIGNNSNSKIEEKIIEIGTSININRYLSKDEILSYYVNNLYFANNRYGIEDASYGYFGISSSELTLSQSAFLASIPNSPTYYDPYIHYEHTKQRQETILKALYKSEYITKIEYEFANAVEIKLVNKSQELTAPHFIELIDSDIKQSINLKENELNTTMSLDLYKKILKIVKNSFAELENKNVTNAAVVILDADTGEVLTLVGTVDYWADQEGAQVNHATTLRQPGSTFKPFIYALGIEKGLTASTLISDVDRTFNFADNLYIPTNYDQRYHGNVTVRTALANSLNIPAVAVQEYIGPEYSYQLFDSINMPSIREQDPRLATALGGFSISLLDLTNAYRIFPNNGFYSNNLTFLKNDAIKVVNEKDKEKVFGDKSEGVAYVITDILADADARRYLFGSYTALNLPFDASVKTGTSQDYRDSLTIGYTGEFVVGVWVGNSDNSSMSNVAGLDGAAFIWNEVMKVTYEYYNTSICMNSCDFSIEKPLYLNNTNTNNIDSFTPVLEKVSGPI